ncbi:response regulator [Spirosoma pollinicola]|uniref:Response regulator n=1 Tax=Spirosoma pollinicola TaxID=2057025 RepID=A0A2K8YZD2_9BACT|nr:response regulator [Spirosoma pollinicola]AUD02959.1 response regulator [Spirosoma pollinicola]
MPKPIRCILLVDDDPDDNFLHQLIIDESELCEQVRISDSGPNALQYLTVTDHPDYVRPDVLILDINMPGMNGFEFLEEYDKLDSQLKSSIVVLMLTTSLNPNDKHKASLWTDIKAYRTKPLTSAMIQEIVNTHFT